MKSRNYVFFYLNGEPHEVRGADVFLPLADYLRVRRQLTGTKIVCAEGDCGACTVLRDFEPINSCIATVGILDGSNIVTIDALAEGEKLSPVQENMMNCDGSQCGFCTPGFVMALTGLAEKKISDGVRSIHPQDVKNAATGNLCRCTGYQPIIEAGTKINLNTYQSIRKRFESNTSKKTLEKIKKIPIDITANDRHWYSATTLASASQFLKKNTHAKILSGGTDIGVQINKGKVFPQSILDIHLIPELYEIKIKGNRVRVGAKISLSLLRRKLESHFKTFPSFLDIFASPQIKNMASIIGNLANASPIGDTLPFLLVADTTVYIASSSRKRSVPISQLWKGYRSLNLKKGEWITHIEFSIPGKNDIVKLYKASQRKDLDISAVNGAFWISMDSRTSKIESARLALGGVAAIPLRITKTEKLFYKKSLSELQTEKILKTLQSDIHPLDDLRGSASFRRVLGHQFMLDYLRKLR